MMKIDGKGRTCSSRAVVTLGETTTATGSVRHDLAEPDTSAVSGYDEGRWDVPTGLRQSDLLPVGLELSQN